MKKKFIVRVVCAALLYTAAAALCAQTAAPASDFTYDLNRAGDGVVITSYRGKSTTVVIPAEIEDMPVKEIGGSAFSSCSGLTAVTFPEGLETIDSYAFFDCSGLTALTFPEGLKTIDSYAFSGCSNLSSVGVPKTPIKYVLYNAFEGCTKLPLKERKKLREAGYWGSF